MDRLALTIKEAAKAGGPGRAKLYDEIRQGRLRAVKIGRSTRILLVDYQNYLASLPQIAPANTADASAAVPSDLKFQRILKK